MKNIFKSISVRLAFRFTVVLTVAVLLLSLAFVWLINSFVRDGQDWELMRAAESIEKEIKSFPASKRLKSRLAVASKKAEPGAKSEKGVELEPEGEPFEDDNSLKKDDSKHELVKESKEAKNAFDSRPSPFPMIPYYISFVVTNSEGNVLFTNDPFLPAVSNTAGETKRLIKKNYYIDGDLNILYYSKEVDVGEKKLNIATSMDMTREVSYQLYQTLPKSVLMAIIPILVISFFISYLITSRTMKPVVKVTRAASKISSSNLGTERLERPRHNDEINDLVMTFNNLFDRLKVDFDREKQFTSDVSHELKTPIAVILGQTNLLLRWGREDAAQLEKSLNSIKKETKSMEAIITNLLQISRLERGKIKPNVEKVNMKEMFLRLKEEFSAVAPAVRIDFSCEESDFSFDSDSELLHQVLTVVLSNSVKYAGDSCRIELKAKKSDKTTIEIEDDGSGFAESILPHVFERFFRGDEAHTRSVGGSGLGLSIAKVIVESLGGSVRAYNTASHGAGIRIIL
nr:HAMP domain-containing histidine kinase [Treponema sp.]